MLFVIAGKDVLTLVYKDVCSIDGLVRALSGFVVVLLLFNARVRVLFLFWIFAFGYGLIPWKALQFGVVIGLTELWWYFFN